MFQFKSASSPDNSRTFDQYCRIRSRKHRELSGLPTEQVLTKIDELRKWTRKAFRRFLRPIDVSGLLAIILFVLSFWIPSPWLFRAPAILLFLFAGYQFTKYEYYWKGYISGYDGGCEDSIAGTREVNRQSGEITQEEYSMIGRLFRSVPYELRRWLIMLPALYLTVEFVSEGWLRWTILIIVAIFTAVWNVLVVGIDETSDIE